MPGCLTRCHRAFVSGSFHILIDPEDVWVKSRDVVYDVPGLDRSRWDGSYRSDQTLTAPYRWSRHASAALRPCSAAILSNACCSGVFAPLRIEEMSTLLLTLGLVGAVECQLGQFQHGQWRRGDAQREFAGGAVQFVERHDLVDQAE